MIIKCDGITKEMPVSVYYVKSQQIKTPLFYSVLKNSKKPLNIEILPSNASDKSYIAWSDDERVAKIHDDKIESKKVGITTIYIKTNDGTMKKVMLIVHDVFIDIILITLFALLIFIIKVKLHKRQDVK